MELAEKRMNGVSILTGPGRFHFFDAALALAEAGMDVQMISGWMPNTERMVAVDFVGRTLGHPFLSSRLGGRRKQLLGKARISECIAADLLQAALSTASGWGLLNDQRALIWAFRFFGWSAARKLIGAPVVHVRSGAGQGGAIRSARAQGSKVVTDHAIAHPATIARALAPEYERYGLACPYSGDSAFWRLVLADCEQADRLVVNSHYVKDTFIENGCSSDRISVAYLGVQGDFLGVKRSYEIGSRVKLLFTGHFELRKGARTLLDACELLKRRKVSFQLQVVGAMWDGKVALNGRDIGEEIEFVPYVPKDVLCRYLAEADIFVFPTFAEGSSRSAMEALGAGLPVVTTKSCGVPIQDGINGLYVEPGDAAALADRIEELSVDADKRTALGTAAAAMVRDHYSWADYAAAMMGIYRSVRAQ